MNKEAQATWGVQASRKINLGNYESAEVSAWISGVPFDMPEDQVSYLISSKIDQILPVVVEELERKAQEYMAQKRSEF